MDVVKIIGVAIIGLIISIIMKQYRPEFAIYVTIITGLVIFFLVSDKMSGIISLINDLSKSANINSEFLKILIKITGIAFLSEFAVSICKDAQEGAIATKIELGTKVLIIAISIPIISSLLEMIIKILP